MRALRRRAIAAAFAAGLLTMVLAVQQPLGNVVASHLPAWLSEHPSVAWTLYVLLAVVLGAGAAWQAWLSKEMSPPPQDPASQLAERALLLNRIRIEWIVHRLDPSLHELPQIELGLEEHMGAVEPRIGMYAQRPNRMRRSISPGISIRELYALYGPSLLILGTPGTGKTTMLLQLARALLDAADRDSSEPIPVVVPLATWSKSRAPLDDWLMTELRELYSVNRERAQSWLASGMLIPLLDGLDEMARHAQEQCIARLNEFSLKYPRVVVSTRADDYKRLRGRLRFSGAIAIQPLSLEQVDEYLEASGSPLGGLRAVVDRDPELRQLLRTPLWLGVAAIAYRDRAPSVIRTTRELGTLDKRREQLFGMYVEAMFARRSRRFPFNRAQTCKWLQWLGAAMRHHPQQPIFYLEQLEPTWLPGSRRRQQAVDLLIHYSEVWTVWAFILPLPVVATLQRPIAILVWLGMALGSGAILVFGAVNEAKGTYKPPAKHPGYGRALQFVEKLTNSEQALTPRQKFRRAAWYVLAVPLTTLTASLIILGLQLLIWPFTRRLPALLPDLILGLAFSVAMQTCMVALELAVGARRRERSRPNWLMRTFAIAGLVVAAAPLVTLAFIGRVDDVVYLFPVLMLGASATAVGFLGYWLRHWLVRLALWWSNAAPLRFVHFLDHATDRVFLYQVVGGYQFIHPLLRDYFAALPGPIPAVPSTLAWLELPAERPSSVNKTAYEAAVAAKDPNLHRVRQRFIATEYEEKGDLEMAKYAYRAAGLEGDAIAIYRLGKLAEQEGDLDWAESCYRASADEGEPSAMYELGRLAEQRDQSDSAVNWYLKGLDMNDASTVEMLGGALRRLARTGETTAVSSLREAAGAGHSWAMYELGRLAEERTDVSEATNWFRMAADAGDPRAMCLLGWFAGWAGALEDAEAHFREAADAGCSGGLHGLAWLTGVQRDNLQESGELYRQAADAGEAGAMFELSMLARSAGFGVERVGWMRRAAETGYEMAQFELGHLAEIRGDPDEATAWYDNNGKELWTLSAVPKQSFDVIWKSFELRDKAAEAVRQLGKAAEANDVEAIHQLLSIADAGDSRAMAELGRLAEGRGNQDEAIEWYHKYAAATLCSATGHLRRLAGSGADTAVTALRQLASTGLPTPARDLGAVAAAGIPAAADALLTLATAGHAEAMHQLAEHVELGAKATRWRRRASETGSTRAMLALGRLAEAGDRQIEARDLYRRAAEAGDDDAAAELRRLSSQHAASQ